MSRFFPRHRRCARAAAYWPVLEALESRALPSFIAAQTYPAGPSPQAVAMADFNGDGTPDLAVANYTDDGTVSILPGNGDGSFGIPATYRAGAYPTSIVAADFDGDGIPDLAVTNYTSAGTVSVLLGNGDGSFQAPVSYAAGLYPSAIAVGDFNGDGIPDLAVANDTSAGTVSVLLGNGDGTFQAPVSYAVGVYPVAVAAADLNMDGRLDLIVVDSGSYPDFHDSGVSVLLGNGDGTFQAKTDWNVGNNPHGVAVADFNGDGRLDLAVAVSGTYPLYLDGGVSVLLANGDGTFQAPVSYAAGLEPVAVAVGDFNNDGRLDLAVADQGGYGLASGVSVLLGRGDGSFQDPLFAATDSGARAVAVGDFNGDGLQDVAVATYAGTVSAFLSDSNGPLARVTTYAGIGLLNSLVAADFNGDGFTDLAAGGGAGVVVFLNAANWGLSTPPVPAGRDGAGIAIRDAVHGSQDPVLRTPESIPDTPNGVLGTASFIVPRQAAFTVHAREPFAGDIDWSGFPAGTI